MSIAPVLPMVFGDIITVCWEITSQIMEKKTMVEPALVQFSCTGTETNKRDIFDRWKFHCIRNSFEDFGQWKLNKLKSRMRAINIFHQKLHQGETLAGSGLFHEKALEVDYEKVHSHHCISLNTSEKYSSQLITNCCSFSTYQSF